MMAQRIQTVCDVHLDRGEDVDAQTWEVLIRKLGTRTQAREVDLCSDCSTPLEAVAAFAAEHGRTVSQSPAKARASVTPANSVTPRPGGNGQVTCPVEGCGAVLASSGNLARHTRNVHNLSAVPRPADQVYPCPDCDRTFTRAQGLGAHRYQAHGYQSPTRAERAEREERAAS